MRGCRRFALVLLFAAAGSAAQTYPESTGWVVDSAHVLSGAESDELTAIADRLDGADLAQLAIAFVDPDYLGPLSRVDYGVELFRRWRLGHSKQRSDGLLLLFVTGPPGHRGLRVEVGHDLEGLLNDGKVGALMDTYAGPELRAGRYGPAAIALATALAREIESAPRPAPPPPPLVAPAVAPALFRATLAAGALAPFFQIALLAVMVLAFLRRRYPSRMALRLAWTGAIACTGAAVVSTFVFFAFPSPFLVMRTVSWVPFGNLVLYVFLRRHRCPKDRGWLWFENVVLVEATPSTPGTKMRTWRCANPGCGYEAHSTSTFELASGRSSTLWDRDVGSSGSSFGSSGGSSSGGSGGWSSGGSESSFGGGGGGTSGGGGADREY